MATLGSAISPAATNIARRGSGYRSTLYRWQRDGLIRGLYFRVLLLLAPIQSVLLTPVQGTTPSTILLLLSMAVLVSGDTRYLKLLLFVAGAVLFYSLFMALSLSAYLIDMPDLSRLTMIRDIYVYGWVRQSNVTQGFYLLVPALFTFVVYMYYQEAFLKYAYFGILLLAFYGFYEFTFFAIYHTNGDFLSNRNFGNLSAASEGAGEGDFATGSLLQMSNLFGPNYMRLKSLVGEPSMYALTVTPFVVYAFARHWWLIFAVLMLSLVLGSSSTAILGLAAGIGYYLFRTHQSAFLYVLAIIVIVMLLYFTSTDVQDRLDTLLFSKLDSGSGSDRIASFVNHASAAFDGNAVRTLFGLGFGTVRSTDMLSNLLANVGIIGLLGYLALFLMPCLLLRRIGDTDAIVAAILSILVMEMIAVSEYAYLPPWFMVALGYARVRQQRAARRTSPV